MTLHVEPLIRAVSRELLAQQQRDDSELFRRASRQVAFSLAMLVWVPVFAVIYTLLHAPIASNIILSGGTFLVGIVLLMRRGVSPEWCGNLLALAAWYVYTALGTLSGGLWAPVMVWYATLPILSVLLAGNRSGLAWTAISAATILAFAGLQELGIKLPLEVTPFGTKVLQVTGLVGLLGCVYLLVSVLKKTEFGAHQALREANIQLEQQATTDGLTSIPNRHRFDQVLEQEWADHARSGQPLSMALIDADHFKAFNDEYGHLAGDDCLRTVARTIQASIRRPRDFCARFGGEEFVIVLPNTDEAGALLLAEAIRDHVRSLNIGHARSPVNACVTVSIGVSTTIPSNDRSHVEFLYDVDMALYRAKEEGRDRIVQVASGSALTV